jgi:hypothetical protein
VKQITTTKNIVRLVVILAGAFLLFRTGKSCNSISHPGQDTVRIVRDTVLVIERHDSTYKPNIINITNPVTYKPYLVTDTLFEGAEPVDTAAILARYYQKVFYVDSQKLARGSVVISDSVSRNRIFSRHIQTFNTDTTITNTITLTQPKKLVVYLGGSIIGNQQKPFYLGGLDLSVKWRDDKIVTLGAFFNIKGQLYYQTGLKYPIKLNSIFHKK